MWYRFTLSLTKSLFSLEICVEASVANNLVFLLVWNFNVIFFFFEIAHFNLAY